MSYRRSFVALVCTLLCASAGWAADPVAPAGTDWVGTGSFKGKLSGAGSTSGPVDIDVHFGPDAGLSLAADEFQISADDGMAIFLVEGTFVVDAKGQPLLTPDPVALETQLKALLIHVCEDILLLKVKTKAGSGGGGTLGLSAKLPFELTSGMEVVRATFSLKTSPPAQLAP
jgi:hypothetical protein